MTYHLHISTILRFSVYSITECFELAIKLTCLKCELEVEIHFRRIAKYENNICAKQKTGKIFQSGMYTPLE